MQPVRIAALVAATLAGATTASAANLIVNGGFEADPVPVGGSLAYSGGQSFTGWSVGGNTLVITSTDAHEGTQYYTAHSGKDSLDLTGPGNTGPDNAVTQTIATLAGKRYNLRFFVGNAGPYGTYGYNLTLPTTVRLSVDGGPLASFTNADVTPYADNFRQFDTSFVARGPTTLKFQNGPANDGHAALDDVTLTAAVPEPATWALLVAGFGLTGAAARRRRGAESSATA